MYNEITRKLTSLTLMAVMVAGGLTFAVPGMEPAYAAGELSVSAEVIGNFAGIQVIEIVVDDPERSETNEAEGRPNVEINSDDVRMVQGDDGIWYGYIANQLAIDTYTVAKANILYGGVFETPVLSALGSDAQGMFNGTESFLDGFKPIVASVNNPDIQFASWPFIQTYNLAEGSDVTISYGSGSTAESIVLEYDYDDGNAIDLSVDRALYPKDSQVMATLNDSLLNLSPTADDMWIFGTNGDITYRVEGTATINVPLTETEFYEIGFEEGPLIINNPDGVIQFQDTDITTLDETIVGLIFKTSDTNDNLFVNYDSNEKSSIVVVQEGDADLTWNDSHSIVFDTFNGSIEFLTLTNEWLSGIELGLELHDEDRNLNSRIDEDLFILDGEVPFIKMGSPITIDTNDNPELRFNSPTDVAFSSSTATLVSVVGADFATGTITLLNVAATDLITINSLVYEADGVGANNNYALGADDTADAISLAAAINIADASLTALANSDTVELTFDTRGIAGNVGITYTDVTISGPATLTGGVDGDDIVIDGDTYTAMATVPVGANEFLLGIDDDADAASLEAVINTATVTTSVLDNVVTITAATAGVAGDLITLTSSGSTITVTGGGFLANGADGYALTGVFTTSKIGELSASAGVTQLNVTVPWTHPTEMDDDTVLSYINYDFSKFGGPQGTLFVGDTLQATGDSAAQVTDISNSTHARFLFDITTVGTENAYFDIFSFGQLGDISDASAIPFTGDIEDNVERVNDAFYRFELEETDDNTATFEGDVEYIMINQLNVFDESTYADIEAADDILVIIVNDDLDDEDSVRVTYLDIDSTGTDERISVQEEANTHSGIISLDKPSYSSGNTIIVTLEDADLNTDSETIQIYESDNTEQWVGDDKVWLVRMLIDDVPFTNQCNGGSDIGLENIDFSFIETDKESGVFIGTLKLPANHCADTNNDGDVDTLDSTESTNGLDLEFEYQDYSDASGEPNETSSSVSVRSNTGSVSLDRTVYPVPFTDLQFPIHETILNGVPLPAGDVNVVIRVNDPDFNRSASGEDTMPSSLVTLEITRGSLNQTIALPPGDLIEIAPDAGIFEIDVEISQQLYDGLKGTSTGLPSAVAAEEDLIEQGDIISVVYTDPADASGDPNTVTDSAAFDLRNGVLQTDKSVYIIGSDAIFTLIEPDLNLDSETAETHSLDLINWDSDAGDISISDDIFDAEPFGLRETGDDTGIFQVIIEIPEEINGDRLERGEEIELEYIDYGPAGANFVGDDNEDINVTIFTSNFGATVELDQKVYTWTDKVYITVVAPDHNFESDAVDEIGVDTDSELNISTRTEELTGYKLVETGTDTGIFTGEVILTGFDTHDADGDGTDGDATEELLNQGPTSGKLPAGDDDGLTISFEFSEDENVYGSALIRWNIGEIQWLEASYPATGTGVVRVIDPDMNWNPEAVDSFAIDVWSDTASGGIDLDVTETNEATGIFEGTVFFTVNDASSGARLAVSEGDTITAEYEDNTLPDPYSTADELDVTATATIGTIVPPLERAPAGNLRAVDAFDNSLDTVQVDQQVQVTADLVNGQDRTQEFAYLLQVQNSDGVTVSLSWITGSLEPGQQFSPAVSWIPTNIGSFDATVFVWESVTNPTALSPPIKVTINVTS